MSGCAAFDPTGSYAGQVLALADCHVLGLVAGGYQALAGGGEVLAGLLTVFVALLGYRLMLGQGPSLGEGAGLLARVVLVLALVTQWPAYQVLVLDVAMGAPRALAGTLAAAAGLGPAEAGAQAAQADALMTQASAILAMPVPAFSVRPGLRMATVQGVPDAVKTPLHWAGALLVVSLLAGWLSTRLVAGVLLGLGPVLLGGLLFAGTRGLALGWMRVLLGAALGQVVVALVIALELDMAQAQMTGLVQALTGGQTPVAMADELLITVGVFAVVLLGGLAAMATVAAGLTWPKAWTGGWPKGWREPCRSAAAQIHAMSAPTRHQAAMMPRAEQIAAAARAMEQRDAGRLHSMRMEVTRDRPASRTRDGASPGQDARVIRLGQSARSVLPRASRFTDIRHARRDANP